MPSLWLGLFSREKGTQGQMRNWSRKCCVYFQRPVLIQIMISKNVNLEAKRVMSLERRKVEPTAE